MSWTSEVTVIDDGIVCKKVFRCREFGVVERERYWLEKLKGSDRFPQLYCVVGPVLVMENRGNPVRRDSLPDDWRNQAEMILIQLHDAGVSHNDIKPTDILVKGGRLSLIDFGWATPIGEPVPDHWPETLGSTFKCPDGFDDRYSMMKSLEGLR